METTIPTPMNPTTNPRNDHNARVLVADDQADVREALRLVLKSEGFGVETVGSPGAVLSALGSREYDAVLIDLNYARDTTSGEEGLDLLSRIQALDSSLPVVVLTAWGTVDLAVEAMRRGARDFLQKPWDNARLIASVRTHIELARALRRSQRLEAENRLLQAQGRPPLIAESASMQPVMDLVSRVSASDANVLITGEHGTGKDVIARTIQALSNRSSKPLVTVNIGGLPESLFESELFGHIKGAFTDAKTDRVGRFELADQGTLFLDEIANLPLNLQAKLLRVLETGEVERLGSSITRRVDVRVLSATNADLRAEVSSGRFREDLLFRLNTIQIHLPPLRERKQDIPLLAHYFLRRYAERYHKPTTSFEEAALGVLAGYSWPGNVRELDHTVERAVLLAQSDLIQPSDLALESSREAPAKLDEMSLEDVERVLIQKAMGRYGGNVTQAARALGLSRSALYRRLQKHEL
jgi:DNA-binding NtrC family response regulator